MEIGKKKKKRGRRCGEAADHHDDDHLEKTDYRMTSKSNKKLKYHRQCPESMASCMDASLRGRKNNTSSCNDIGCKKEKEEQMKVGGVGVFDFPWLKEEGEGVIFKLGDDSCQPAGIMGLLEEYTFALYSTTCSPSASAALSPSPPPPLPFTTTFSHMEDNFCCSSSALPVLFHHQDHANVVTLDDRPPPQLSPFNVDSDNNINQQMDCIWSSALDQPLDINLNIL